MATLGELRGEIDRIDAAVVELLAKRLEVCSEVAEIKSQTGSEVIQPARVREVLSTRRQWAIDRGVDADFAEQIFRTLLAETHRIEVAGGRGDSAPSKQAGTDARSALDTVACRIDHVVVAVDEIVTVVVVAVVTVATIVVDETVIVTVATTVAAVIVTTAVDVIATIATIETTVAALTPFQSVSKTTSTAELVTRFA